MFKDLTVTLYDVFGYLLPGVVALLAVLLGTWAAFYPTSTALVYGYGASFTTAVLGVAYLFGHVIQAAGNKLDDLIHPDRAVRESITTHLAFNAIETRILQAFGVGRHQLTPIVSGTDVPDKVDVYRDICDRANVAAGKTSERDTLMHRKDLYRGVFIALGLLVLALLLVVWRAPMSLGVSAHARLSLAKGPTALWVVICILGMIGAWARYHRFARYRFEEAFLTFAACQFLAAEVDDAGADE